MSKSWKIGSLVNVIFCRLNLKLHCLSGERVALKLPSRLCIKFRWSGFFILNGVQFSSQEEFVKSVVVRVDVNCLVSFTRHLLPLQQVPWSRSNWSLNCEIGEAVKSGTPEDSSRSFLEV